MTRKTKAELERELAVSKGIRLEHDRRISSLEAKNKSLSTSRTHALDRAKKFAAKADEAIDAAIISRNMLIAAKENSDAFEESARVARSDKNLAKQQLKGARDELEGANASLARAKARMKDQSQLEEKLSNSTSECNKLRSRCNAKMIAIQKLHDQRPLLDALAVLDLVAAQDPKNASTKVLKEHIMNYINKRDKP